MANIKLTLPGEPFTKQIVTFTAPCNCDQVTDGLIINGKTYTVCDAMGNTVTGKGGAWCAGATVAVALDVEAKKAYVQNAATSGYLEEKMGRMQEAIDDALDTLSRIMIPSPAASLTYNGAAQSPTWVDYDSSKMTISGTTSATAAGTYTAKFTPTGIYKWSDGTTATKSVTWTINKASVAVPSQSGTLTYTGSAQSPSWSNYSSTKLTLSVTAQTNAGTYSATFTPKTNYQWSDGTTAAKSVSWTIGRQTISAVPSQSGTLTYSGSAQSPSWSNYTTTKMTLGGTTSGTNAGSYSATFTPSSNYKWSDGTTTAKTVTWTIGKASGSISLSATSVALSNSTTSKAVTVTRSGNGTITAKSSNTNVATVTVSGTTVTIKRVNRTDVDNATATITVSVAAGTNHNATSATIAVTAKYLPDVGTPLNDCTWQEISMIASKGLASTYFSVGDTKTITLNGTVGKETFDNVSIGAFIIGFDHNSEREGTNTIHFEIGKIGGVLVSLIETSVYGNRGGGKFHACASDTTSTGSDGWDDSPLRQTVLGNTGTPAEPVENSLMAALPLELRNVLRPIPKRSTNKTSQSTDYSLSETQDYLFTLAEYEYFGRHITASYSEPSYLAQYEYYRAGNSAKHYKYNATTEPCEVWTRSIRTEDCAPVYVTATGSTNRTYLAYSYGISPAFVV